MSIRRWFHSDSKGWIYILPLLVILSAGGVRAQKSDGTKSKEAERIMTPYLIIDVARNTISLRLAGVALREYRFVIPSGSDSTGASVSDSKDEPSVGQTVQGVHLLSAAKAIPERELEIITEETGRKPHEIQRYIPERMVITTDDGFRIFVESDCPGAEDHSWEKIKEFFRQMWYGLMGSGSLRVSMSAEDAMSIYGVALDKPPIIIKR
jgi:hypothetical protein